MANYVTLSVLLILIMRQILKEPDDGKLPLIDKNKIL